MAEPKQPYKFKIEAADGTQIESDPAYIEFAKQHKDVEDVEVKFTSIFPLCSICGKPSIGVVLTFGEDAIINQILTDKNAQSVVYYCAEHEPIFPRPEW